MMRYSIEPRYQIFIRKKMNKKLNVNYSQKLLDYFTQSATDALKTTSKRANK